MVENWVRPLRTDKSLRYKTQVVPAALAKEYDVTQRGTHTNVVRFMAQQICSRIGVAHPQNDDHYEAVMNASTLHDFGHPPFGHEAEEALDKKMSEQGLSFSHGDKAPNEARRLELDDLTIALLEGKRDEGMDVAKIIHDWADDFAWLTTDLDDGARMGFIDSHSKELSSLNIVNEAILVSKESLKYKHEETHGSVWNWWIVTLEMGKAFTRSVVFERENENDVVPRLEKGRVMNGRFFMLPEVKEEFEIIKKFLFKNYYKHPNLVSFSETITSMINTIFDKKLDEMSGDSLTLSEKYTNACEYVSNQSESDLIKEYESISGDKVVLPSPPIENVPLNPGNDILIYELSKEGGYSPGTLSIPK